MEQADSSSFDIVLPPSLSVSASTGSSSVAAGSSFTANVNIANNGETTANDVTIAVSGTGMSLSSGCGSVSAIDEGQSAAQSCTITASTAGSQTVTFTASSTNAEDASGSFTITVTGGAAPPGGDGTTGGTGPSGGPEGPPGKAKNASKRPELVPGVGLRNNTKLQAAIEKVLAKGKISEQARENMLRLSASITSNISTTRMFNASEGRSRIRTIMRYKGRRNVSNLMVYESVPKDFASNASAVTVTAPGAIIEVVEEDPSWVVTYPAIRPDDEILITYEVQGEKSPDVLDAMQTEVYAESVEAAPEQPPEAICTPTEKRCIGNELQECSADGTEWGIVETCWFGCDSAKLQCKEGPIPSSVAGFPTMIVVAAIVIIVIAIAAAVMYMKRKPKKTEGLILKN